MTKKIVSFIFQRMTMSRVLIMNLHSVRGEVRNSQEIGCSPEFNTHK